MVIQLKLMFVGNIFIKFNVQLKMLIDVVILKYFVFSYIIIWKKKYIKEINREQMEIVKYWYFIYRL